MGKWAQVIASQKGVHFFHNGKTIRANPNKPDEVDAHGGEGDWATWFPEKVGGRGAKVFMFRNKKTGKYLRIDQHHKTDADGGGGQLCHLRLKWHNKAQHIVCLESVKHPGDHVGVLPDGHMKPANNTGEGPHAHLKLTLNH